MVNMKRLAGVAMAVCALAQTAQAISTVDKPASILTWPKIVVDAAGRFSGGAPVDTLIQLSNTSPDTLKQAHCVLVNANSHCADNAARVCQTSADCVTGATTSECDPGWNEIDFDVFLTFEQPLAWYAGDGLQRGQFPKEGPFFCNAPINFVQCFSDAICAGFGCNIGQSNLGSGIPSAPEDPFQGSLTCVQYTGGTPSVPDQGPGRNALIGEAAIVVRNDVLTTTPPSGVDVQKYNAVGLRAKATAPGTETFDLECVCPDGTAPEFCATDCSAGTRNAACGPACHGTFNSNCTSEGTAAADCAAGVVARDNALQIGGSSGAEYDACPATLILSHLFDGATDPMAGAGFTNQTVTTDLTLVPCGNNIAAQAPGRVTAQFLVFNEFEQRFSTSRTVDCFYESLLSSIDTRNPLRSIFSAGVGGSIAGQTRIRGVGTGASGQGLLGVARLFVKNGVTGVNAGAAYNLHQQGDSTGADIITLP